MAFSRGRPTGARLPRAASPSVGRKYGTVAHLAGPTRGGVAARLVAVEVWEHRPELACPRCR